MGSLTLQDWVAIAQIASSIAAVVLAGLTLVYIFQTRAMVAEMRRTREAAERPTIVAYVELVRVERTTLAFRNSEYPIAIRNVGRDAAFEVAIRRTDDQLWNRGSEPAIGVLTAAFLPGDGRVRRYVFPSPADAPIPVEATWKDQAGKAYRANFAIEPTPVYD